MSVKPKSKHARQVEQQIEALQRVLLEFSAGASLQDLVDSTGLDISRRTIIRRLEAMIERGIVRKSGHTRAARYILTETSTDQTDKDVGETFLQPDFFVRVSKKGGEILQLVSQPAGVRNPAGYNRNFLYDYIPNKTGYLTDREINKLEEISKTVVAEDQPAGTYAGRILSRLLIDLSWNSSRLEGNTYSLLDTERLIEGGEEAEGKSALDAQMILNHKAAIEFLVQSAEDIGFNRYTILNLHGLLSENLLPDPAAAGRIRRVPVAIGKSVYHPLEVPQLLEECFNHILETAETIQNPFEQAFFIMVQLPYLQPFEDVNKRVSRLAANIPLIRQNLSPLSFIDVPDATYILGTLGVYELNRIELLKDVFIWAYERSAARYAAIRQSIGDPDPFRLRYRQLIKQIVSEVIKGHMNKKEAAKYIPHWSSEHVKKADVPRFIEIVETELLSLHEGNFARYQIRPTEYNVWRQAWD